MGLSGQEGHIHGKHAVHDTQILKHIQNHFQAEETADPCPDEKSHTIFLGQDIPDHPSEKNCQKQDNQQQRTPAKPGSQTAHHIVRPGPQIIKESEVAISQERHPPRLVPGLQKCEGKGMGILLRHQPGQQALHMVISDGIRSYAESFAEYSPDQAQKDKKRRDSSEQRQESQ